jgi:drug/metabolite transporter (DMT)-like permease
MAYVLAVGAALANAITTILQRIGVESAPQDAEMHLSLITHAIHKRIWLFGALLMIASFGMQGTALAHGRLSIVQPVLTLELPILVIILVVWFGQRIGWHEVVGAIAAAGGLTAFLTLASPTGGDEVPSFQNWGLAVIAGIAAIAISVGLARAGKRPAWRAAWFGTSAAISYAFTAAFVKEVTEQIGIQWYSPFLSWQLWAMAIAGILGVFLTQNAFHAGPVTASQATLVIVDPLVSLLIGIGIFGDNLQTQGARGPLESIALIVLFGGVYFLARSPLVATVRSEEEGEDHLLGARHHHHSTAGLLGAQGAADLAHDRAARAEEKAQEESGGDPISGGEQKSGNSTKNDLTGNMYLSGREEMTDGIGNTPCETGGGTTRGTEK